MELEYELSGVVQRHRSDKPVFLVGRGPGMDLQILDTTVSSKHARITDGADLATVEDLGSTNGTRLNEEIVTSRASFGAGDRLMFGRIVVRVLSIGAGPSHQRVMGLAPPPPERTTSYAGGGRTGPDEAQNGLALLVDQTLVLAPDGGIAVPEGRLSQLLKALPRLGSARGPAEVVARLAALALETVSADLVAVFTSDERTGGLVRAHARGRDGAPPIQPDPSVNPGMIATGMQTLQGGKAVYTGRPETPGGHKGIHVPLISGGRRLGLLSAWVQGGVLGCDVRLLGILANQAAAALEGARGGADEMSRVLGTILQELRPPLAALQGQAEMPQEHIAAYLDYAANELTQLVEAESGDGRIVLAPQPFDIWAVVSQVQQYQAVAAQQKGCQLAVQPPPGPVAITTDPKRLGEALHHLVGAAIKVAPPGAQVSLNITPEGRRARFSIWDPAPADQHTGTLGVACGRRLVAALGAELIIGGDPSTGTTLSFALPL